MILSIKWWFWFPGLQFLRNVNSANKKEQPILSKSSRQKCFDVKNTFDRFCLNNNFTYNSKRLLQLIQHFKTRFVRFLNLVSLHYKKAFVSRNCIWQKQIRKIRIRGWKIKTFSSSRPSRWKLAILKFIEQI